ncbi:MAG: thiamine pyrophosphate-dependent enzyme [Turicibacter sanguinis]|uniref:thiamine pyrophosphate-dependent enzyme n=1 Tax=Turicibacter sanguinis TaxID=154288 RepID=UPI003994FEF8
MYKDYLLEEKMPLFWCAGCGNGITLQAIFRGMDSLGWTKENTVVTTGIGCWGKADDYVTTNSFHGTHGRALPVSTGIALANPDLNVVTLMGDGDGATIGGNHLIHAARRNINLTAILVNNLNYGMTGGQYSGTTPKHAITKTSPYGHVENGFDICKLVAASGAPYVARATVFDVVQLQKLIKEAMSKKGFALVEVISPCPTHYGRSNKIGNAPAMLQWIKDNTVSKVKADTMPEEELVEKYVTGVFADRDQPDYGTLYQEIIEQASGGR